MTRVLPYVYAEQILLTGFAMNALILYAASSLVQFRGAHLRRLSAATFGAVCALFLLMWQTGGWADILARLFLPVIMTWIVTAKRGKRVYFRFLTAQWLTAFLCAGASMCAALFSQTQLLRANVWVADAPAYALGAGAALAVLFAGWMRAFIQNARIQDHCATLCFRIGADSFCCIGFFDTGHLLRDPATGRHVAIVEASVLRAILHDMNPFCAISFLQHASTGVLAGRISLVPFRSVGGDGVLAAVRPDEAFINGMRADMLIAIFDGTLDDVGRYRALLPTNTMRRV